MKNLFGIARSAVAIIVFLFVFSAYAIDKEPSSTPTSSRKDCEALFTHADAYKSVMKEIEVLLRQEPASQLIKNARYKLTYVLGAEDTISLFGTDFNDWPVFLGQSDDGHIILAFVDARSKEIRISSLKKLTISTEEYLRRLNQHFDRIEGNAGKSADEMDLKKWLESTEPDFDRIISAFTKKNNLTFKSDDFAHNPLDAIMVRSPLGVQQQFSNPWLMRSTAIYTPHGPGGKQWRSSTPDEIAPLVRDLILNEKK